MIENEEEEPVQPIGDEISEFRGIIKGILADDEVNYKEAYELLYWLEDHAEIAEQHRDIYLKTKEVLEDDYLDKMEAMEMKNLLNSTLKII